MTQDTMIPGTKEIVQAAFSYGPTSAFSFLVGFMVIVIAFMAYALVFIFKQNTKYSGISGEAMQKEKMAFVDIIVENKECITNLKRAMEDLIRVTHESVERDKELYTRQMIVIDLIKDLKR